MLNLTPHAITVRTLDGDITFPPSGTMARVTTSSEHLQNTSLKEGKYVVPVMRRSFGSVEGLPSPIPEEGVLVSGMVLEAIKAQGHPGALRIFAPDTGDTALRNEKGHIVAVMALSGV